MGIPSQPPPPSYPPSRAQWRQQRAQWKMQSRMQRAAYRASRRTSTRRSILGPLFLIAIGVFALLMTTHRIHAAAFWQWYGHWWPLLLIGAGVLLALESLVWARHARIRLGGGMVLLIILLALLGVAVSHNHFNWRTFGNQWQLDNNFNLDQMFGSKHESSEQIVHAMPANGTLIVENARGDVTISTGSDDQMHLSLDKSVYSNSDTDAKRMMDAMEPLITTSGTVVTVHMPAGNRQAANLSFAIPASTAVLLRTDRGDVNVSGRQAAVTINSNRGDVQLTDIVGPVQVTMHRGDFSASNIQGDLVLNGRMNDLTLSQVTGSSTVNGDYFGDVHLERLLGPLHLHSSRTDIQLAQLAGSVSLDGGNLEVENATGPVSVSTRAKNVTLHDIRGEVQASNSNGGIEVTALDPVGAMNIENRNGSVRVTVPEDAKFSVQGSSIDGEAKTDFNLSVDNANHRSVVSGSVGGGGPLLHIDVKRGDIYLRKAGTSTSQ